MILNHPTTLITPYKTKEWLEKFKYIDRHFHIRASRKDDINRMIRHLIHSAYGLAFSGGSSRAMAHIGALKAFEEKKIPLDIISGASSGAIIAAARAMEMSIDEIFSSHTMVMHDAKLEPWHFTLPLLSLFSFLAAKTFINYFI